MATRIIRDGILTSERINLLTPHAELFYRRLMSVADDYGRFSANPTLLRAACYPLKLDSVKEDSIKKHLAECVDAGLIVLYTVADKTYLEMQDFGQRQQSKSKYPDPPESTVDHGGSRESTALVGVGVGVEDVVVKGRSKPQKTRIPTDFDLSDGVKAWAKEKGHSRLPERLEHFRTVCQAKGYEYVDWDAAFKTAVRDDWAKLLNASTRTGRRQVVDL